MQDSAQYRERLSVPVRWWLLAAGAVLTLWLVVAIPAGEAAGIVVAGLGAVLLTVFFIRYGGAVVAVDAHGLRAGQARIERSYLGKAEALTGEAARNAFGRECDPKAYLLLRAYALGAVRVEVTDPHDPAPYWLLATRHPERLAAALSGNRASEIRLTLPDQKRKP